MGTWFKSHERHWGLYFPGDHWILLRGIVYIGERVEQKWKSLCDSIELVSHSSVVVSRDKK